MALQRDVLTEEVRSLPPLDPSGTVGEAAPLSGLVETPQTAKTAESASPGSNVPERVDALGELAPRTIRHPDPIAILTGALSAALGFSVLMGWHLGSVRLIQVQPGSSPMAYNTAASFVGLGMAFLAIGFGWRVAARLTAAVFGLISLAILVQYMTAAPWQLETILARISLPEESIVKAPMAPNTSIGFVLIAVAMLFCSASVGSRRRTTAIVLCGSTTAALGLNAFAGYLAGLQTYVWGEFKAMAIHTSAGFILLGVGTVVFSWRELRQARIDRRSWTLVMVAMSGAVTSISLWQALSSVEKLHFESAVQLRSDLSDMVLIFGLLLTMLLGAAVYLAQTARLQIVLAESLREKAEREVAERKRALEALGASERKYRTLLENLPQKIAYKDRRSIYWSCNENFARDLKIHPSEINGKTDYDFFPRELAEKYRGDDARVMESGIVSEIEETYIQDGRMLDVHTVKSPVRDEAGNVAGEIVIFWDVSTRKRAEEAVQRAAAYNRKLIEASLDPLVTIAPDGRITEVNHATELVTGCGRQELIGSDFSDFFTDPEKAQHGYQQVFREGSVQDYELEIRHRDGSTTPVLYNASVYRDEAGAVVGVFAAARDITQRKHAEEALEQNLKELARSNADLEQFAYVASHDLKEPLRMVANFTQLLAERYRDQLGPDGAEFIGYAVDGASRMQRLIDDLLAFSRVSTRGKSFEPTDCNELMAQALANLQIAIEESRASVTHDELPMLMGDSSQLLQLFQNLVANGIKFHSEAPPRVHVSAARQENQWVFSVRDNGIGIDPQFAELIFVIFQRLHNRGEYPGTGIGLALCKKIVERHRGRIWVESKPGQGATFFFTIPILRSNS